MKAVIVLLQRLHWTTLIAVGAVLNVLVNYGYKVTSGETDVAWIATGSLTVTAIIMLLHGLLTHGVMPRALFAGRAPLVILAVGGAVVVVFICFLTALATGPISLVDPLWACVYALVSVAIGMLMIRERPNAIALAGIGLYLLGAVMMAQG